MREIKVVPCPWHDTGFTLRRENAIIWPDGHHKCCGTEAEAIALKQKLEQQAAKKAELERESPRYFNASGIEEKFEPSKDTYEDPRAARPVETRPLLKAEDLSVPTTGFESDTLNSNENSAAIEQARPQAQGHCISCDHVYYSMAEAQLHKRNTDHDVRSAAAEPAPERTPAFFNQRNDVLCCFKSNPCGNHSAGQDWAYSAAEKIHALFNNASYFSTRNAEHRKQMLEGWAEIIRAARAVAVPEPAHNRVTMSYCPIHKTIRTLETETYWHCDKCEAEPAAQQAFTELYAISDNGSYYTRKFDGKIFTLIADVAQDYAAHVLRARQAEPAPGLMPSCTLCGAIMRGVCPECNNKTGIAEPAPTPSRADYWLKACIHLEACDGKECGRCHRIKQDLAEASAQGTAKVETGAE